jgi:hypothetical protein
MQLWLDGEMPAAGHARLKRGINEAGYSLSR